MYLMLIEVNIIINCIGFIMSSDFMRKGDAWCDFTKAI